MLGQICREVGYKDAPPFCGALSFQYFQTLMETDIIMTPQTTMDAIGKTSTLWTSLWHVEFACDMVATYWCGPAYGLANVRLSATRGDPYLDSGTHPADDARKTGIECILRLAGESAAANE